MAKKSPDNPRVDLPSALTRLETLYTKAGHLIIQKEELVGILGYASVSGTAHAMIGALSQYCLLWCVQKGRSYRVSDAGLFILEQNSGATERLQALEKAAFSPPVFDHIHREFGEFPSDKERLLSHLLDMGFTNGRAPHVLRIYSQNIDYLHGQGRLIKLDEASVQSVAQEKRSAGFKANPPPHSLFSPGLLSPALITDLVAQFRDLPLQVALTSTCGCRVMSNTGTLTRQAGERLFAFLQSSKGIYPQIEGDPNTVELSKKWEFSFVVYPVDEFCKVLILFYGQVTRSAIDTLSSVIHLYPFSTDMKQIQLPEGSSDTSDDRDRVWYNQDQK